MERYPISREELKDMGIVYLNEVKRKLVGHYVSEISRETVEYARLGYTEFLYRVKYKETIPNIEDIVSQLQQNFPGTNISPVIISTDYSEKETYVIIDVSNARYMDSINGILLNWF
jgi:hypothetical protein